MISNLVTWEMKVQSSPPTYISHNRLLQNIKDATEGTGRSM